MKKIFGIFFILSLYISTVAAQERLVDKVIATVGSAYILQSDLEMEYTQFLAQGNKPDEKNEVLYFESVINTKTTFPTSSYRLY